MEDYSVRYSFEREQRIHNREIRIGNAQGIGQREEQQDSFGYVMEKGKDGYVAAVLCDGMGGLDSGRDASQFATDQMMLYLREDKGMDEIVSGICERIHQINRELFQKNWERQVRSGSTLIAGIISEDRFYWASVGDSRIYLYREDQIHQVNRDHNYYQILLSQYFCGSITREQLEQAEGKAALSSYMGKNCDNQIDYSVQGIQLRHKDKIVICSDGVYQNLTQEEMKLALRRHSNDAADKLKRLVEQKNVPGQDNLTAMVLEYRKR